MIIARRQRRPYILNPETLKRRACALEILGGPHFAVTGAGESHGPAVTTIVHGCPAGLELSREAVQVFLDRRRPGSNKLGTPRREADKVVLLSGLYNEDHDSLLGGAQIATHVEDNEVRASGYERGSTTGEPIAAVVLSAARRSADYTQFLGPEGDVRPGHTDLVKHFKSGGFLKRLQRGIVERTQHRDRQYVPKTVDGDHLIGLGEFAGHEHYQLGSISN